MIIRLSPILADGTLSLARYGDALIVNGLRIDFSSLGNGLTLPRAAVEHPAIAGEVTRRDGSIEVVLLLPYASGADEDVTHPHPITLDADGPVSAPGLIDPGPETGVVAIDMAQAVDLSMDAVPASVSRFQARAALLRAGHMASVEVAIGAADDLTKLAWADAQVFRRDSVAIATIAAALGFSGAQIDDLFRAAASIEA